MKAVVVSEYGGPDVLKAIEVSQPHAGPGQIRVHVRAAAVNPADVHIRTGEVHSWFDDVVPRPLRPGMDLAGFVDEIGEGAQTELSVGDAVMGMVIPMDPSGGSYAEYVALDPRQVTRTPAGFSLVEAATIPMNGLTARLALDLLALPSGTWVAVTGAAGAVGGFAIEIAKADGLHVIADAKPADTELIRRLGADEVLLRGDGYAREIRETHADGVDAVIDAALLGGRIEPAIRTRGQLATLRSAGQNGTTPLPGRADIVIHEVVVLEYRFARDKLDALRELAEAGRISARVADVYPTDGAAEAHRRLESGGVRGRLVLTF
jgi:NADPH:quinone reductase-like Zn-dependent oxidoreductase